jgi:hypothetical protein
MSTIFRVEWTDGFSRRHVGTFSSPLRAKQAIRAHFKRNGPEDTALTPMDECEVGDYAFGYYATPNDEPEMRAYEIPNNQVCEYVVSSYVLNEIIAEEMFAS